MQIDRTNLVCAEIRAKPPVLSNNKGFGEPFARRERALYDENPS